MKKAALFIAAFIIISFFLCINVSAEGGDWEKLIENVPESAEDIFDMRSATDMDTDSVMDRILIRMKDAFRGIFGDALKDAVIIISAVIFCALASSFTEKKDGEPDYIILAGAIAIISVTVTGKGSFIEPAVIVTDELDAFSKALLPTITTLSAGSGAVTSAAVKYAASALFMDILITGVRNIIIPLIYIFATVSAASAVFSEGALSSAAGLIKKIIYLALTAIAFSFTLYLTITGVAASSADAAAVKLTKTALSSLIPVVGRVVSDAADSVISGISVIKNTAGVFGILVICAVCAVPFLRLSANWAVYKTVSAFTGGISGKSLSKLIDDMGTAFGMALAAAGTEAVVLFISVISFLKMVS